MAYWIFSELSHNFVEKTKFWLKCYSLFFILTLRVYYNPLEHNKKEKVCSFYVYLIFQNQLIIQKPQFLTENIVPRFVFEICEFIKIRKKSSLKTENLTIIQKYEVLTKKATLCFLF